MSLVSLLIVSVRSAIFSENENACKRSVYRRSVAEMVGFEPTYRLPDKRISSNATKCNLPIDYVISSQIKTALMPIKQAFAGYCHFCVSIC